jgi:hypothetical protein
MIGILTALVDVRLLGTKDPTFLIPESKDTKLSSKSWVPFAVGPKHRKAGRKNL